MIWHIESTDRFRIMVVNASFQHYFSYMVAVRFIGGVNRRYPEKITDLPPTSHWQILSHNVVSSTPCNKRGFELTTLVMIGTDCTGSYKFNYHTITTAPESTDTLISQSNQFRYWISMLTLQELYVRISILLRRGKHLHGRIISLRGDIWAHNTRWKTPLSILRMIKCARIKQRKEFVITNDQKVK